MPHVRGHSTITLEQLRNIARANEPVPPKPPVTVPPGTEPLTFTFPPTDVDLAVGGAAPIPSLQEQIRNFEKSAPPPSKGWLRQQFPNLSDAQLESLQSRLPTITPSPLSRTISPELMRLWEQGQPLMSPLHPSSFDLTQPGVSAESTPAFLPIPQFDITQPVTRSDIREMQKRSGWQRFGTEMEKIGKDPTLLALSLIPQIRGVLGLIRGIGRPAPAWKLAPGYAARQGVRTRIPELAPITRDIEQIFPAARGGAGAAARTTAAKRAAARAKEMARGLHAKVAIDEQRALVATQAREALEAKIPLARKRLDMPIVQAGEEVSPTAALPGAAPAAGRVARLTPEELAARTKAARKLGVLGETSELSSLRPATIEDATLTQRNIIQGRKDSAADLRQMAKDNPAQESRLLKQAADEDADALRRERDFDAIVKKDVLDSEEILAEVNAAIDAEVARSAPATALPRAGEARRVFSAAEGDVDRVIRNEAEFFLETSDDQLRAAREAERQANIKLADTQAMSRGKFAKEELTKSDLERGRIVGPQPQTIPTTSGTSMPANDLADGFTLQTTSAGTKRVRVETVLPNELTNAGAVSSAPKGKFVGSMRPIEEIVPEVVGIDNPVGRVLSSFFVNPSTALRSPSGKLLIAYYRQRIAIGELIETALGGALDSHAQMFTGRMPLPINSQGIWGKTGKMWNDVFSRPNDFKLSTAERAYIDDFLTVVSEIEAERIAAGLTPIPKFSIEGWLYVPRQVREVGGVTIKRPTNPKLLRFHEEAVEGHSQGVRYEADPRATLSSHMRSAYDEILKKQLDDALEPLSITPEQLISQNLRNQMSKVEAAFKAAEKEVNRLTVPRIRRDILSKEQLAAEKTLRAALAPERKAAQRNLDKIRPKYDKVKATYTSALLNARAAEVAPGELFGLAKGDISVHLWKNKFLPYEDAKILSEVLGTMGGRSSSGFEALGRRSARGMELIGNQVRFLSAVGDFAEPFIQGLPVLSTNPRIWWKATTRHYAAFANPRVQARYIKENRDTFLEMSSYGIPVGDPEFFAALSQGQGLSIGQLLEVLPKGAEARRLLQVGGKQTFGRFQASYNTGLSIARAELWKSLKPTWNDSLDELAAYVRNLTGGLDSRALGVGPSQRGFESVWMAFSPRLLRSSVALVSDAVRGSAAFVIPGSKATARQQASMKTMAGFIGGVHGVYILSGLSIGKSWDEIMEGLNPLNGKKYLSHRINDDWIGVGGQIRAMIQLQFKIARVIKSGDIDDFISLSTYDNPILQMAASRGAVGLRMAGTVVEGLSGGRIDALPYAHVDSISDIFLHLGKSALPFSVQGKLDGEGVVATIASEVGARTSAGLPTEKLADLRQQVMTKHDIPGDFYSKTFDADAKDEVDALGGQDIEQMKKEVSKWHLEKGDEYEVYKVDRAKAIKEFNDKVNAAFEKMLPLNRGRDFRLQVSEWQRDLHKKKEALKEQHSTALEFLEELEPSESVFQDAIDVYISRLENAGLEDTVTGDYDYAKRNKILEYLSKDEELGAEMVERIETYLHKNDPEPIKQLRADREFLKPYFDMERNLVIAAGLEKKYEIYLNETLLGPVLADVFLDDPKNKYLKDIILDARDIRRDIRESELPKNREIQKRLFFWGYIDKPPPEAIPGLVERYRQAVPR